MINHRRMKYIKSENKINFYLYRPTIFSLYYNDIKKHREEPVHRFSLPHKLHMLWYVLSGGYRILYLEKDNEILSYIIFINANRTIIRSCEKNDYYTIFLWTYPEHRGKGLATMMSKVMLNDLSIPYSHFYKTINKDNIASICVAEKCGFHIRCESVKKEFFTRFIVWTKVHNTCTVQIKAAKFNKNKRI